jgi:hypothetical protein
VPPVKPRSRQIEQARFVLVDQPSPLLGGGPILAGNFQRSDEFARLPLDYGKNRAMLRSDYGGNAALEYSGLFAGNFFQGIAKKIGVIDRNARDDRC